MTNSAQDPTGPKPMNAEATGRQEEADELGARGKTHQLAAAAAAARAAPNGQPADSDSGHGPTSGSSSGESQCSEETRSLEQDTGQDCFVDALETSPDERPPEEGVAADQAERALSVGHEQPQELEEERELKVRLAETTLILRMALNNEFVKALEICGRRADRELYASLANATLSFLRAALTLEQADLQAALASINQSFEVSSRRRRKSSTASMMMRLLYRPNYNTYSDDQIHAELVHAESLLLLALISFLADQSIICLVKGAFRIRACYQRYKECLYIMENRREWSSPEARDHFESGVRMGHGIFNLLMSYLPRRVLRFLEYVGFSGNRTIGVDELDRSVEIGDGLRSVFSALVILTYHSYIDNLFGLGNYDEHKVDQLNNKFLAHYPNSAFFLLFRGRYYQMQGDLVKAIDSFERCIGAQNDWKQFHSICHWEIMWCYAVQMDWPKAAYYSDLLRKQSKWSPASYTYQYATFLYAQLVEDERAGKCTKTTNEHQLRLNEIRQIMAKVPELRIRYAGKTIPAEKFAITRSMRFCEQNNRLSLPALEFLYIWNIFCTLRNSPTQVERLLERINSEIDYITSRQVRADQLEIKKELDGNDEGDDEGDDEEKDDDEEDFKEANESNEEANQVDNWYDDLSLITLLKGMCLKHLGRSDEAEACFMRVVDSEPLIRLDTFLVPHAAMELAILKLATRQLDEAKNWIKLARQNFTGYLLETIVHFRLHAASRMIRLELELELEHDQQEQEQIDKDHHQSHQDDELLDSAAALALEQQQHQQQGQQTNPLAA